MGEEGGREREMRVQALSARAERGDERQVRKSEQARWELLLGFLKAAEFSLVVYAISRVNLFFHKIVFKKSKIQCFWASVVVRTKKTLDVAIILCRRVLGQLRCHIQ